MDGLNRWLDRLPRTRVGLGGREAPAFRTCGITGFYVGVILTMGAGFLGRRSLLALAGVLAVCAFSFFAWALARRAVTGYEELVLLEHVWFAEVCSAAFCAAIGVPVLAHLDAVAVGLCCFLAAGRVGCLLVGCCHGRPSSTGIVYDAQSVGHLAGVRLFPVQAIEAFGLAVIGVTGLAAMPFARPGDVMAWFLIAYAVMRFGLEGIRGDDRPHALGLSQARWMAMAETAVAIAVVEGREHALDLSSRTLAPAVLLLGLFAVTVGRWIFGRERRLLRGSHRAEALAAWAELRGSLGHAVAVRRTSAGLSLALSHAEDGRLLHLSASLTAGPHDLALLCDLVAPLVPRARVVHVAPGPVLHLLVARNVPPDPDVDGRHLHGDAGRVLQRHEQAPPPVETPTVHASNGDVREGYFARSG